MATSAALTGGCQCGAIKYSSTVLPNHFTDCHCITCSKVSGAAFLTFGEFPASAITWTVSEGALGETSYSKIASRTHCKECGSPLSMRYKIEPDYISITAGTINRETVKGTLPGIKSHIFVREGAAWEALSDDGKPRYPQFSPVFQKRLDDESRR